MSQPEQVPPELYEAVTRLRSLILVDGSAYQTIPLERVAPPSGSTVETFQHIAELVCRPWLADNNPTPAHDWRVHYDPPSAMFVAMSRRELARRMLDAGAL